MGYCSDGALAESRSIRYAQGAVEITRARRAGFSGARART